MINHRLGTVALLAFFAPAPLFAAGPLAFSVDEQDAELHDHRAGSAGLDLSIRRGSAPGRGRGESFQQGRHAL